MAENWLLDRAGYGRDLKTNEGYVLLGVLDPSASVNGTDVDFLTMTYEPELWELVKNNNILMAAHQWLGSHWAEVYSGNVIDVEFITGRSVAPKISDRFEG